MKNITKFLKALERSMKTENDREIDQNRWKKIKKRKNEEMKYIKQNNDNKNKEGGLST